MAEPLSGCVGVAEEARSFLPVIMPVEGGAKRGYQEHAQADQSAHTQGATIESELGEHQL